MDNFTKLPKMQCFKEGGSVQKKIANYQKRERKSDENSDMVQDKAIVKKAIGMHDKQEHPGEKTDLSKLRKGGRAKKEVGTVKKFKCGGGTYGAKMSKEDIKNVDAAKNCKPKMLADGGSLKDVDANENPGLAKLPTDVRNKMGYAKKGGKIPKKMCGGKSVKKMADGGMTDPNDIGGDALRSIGKVPLVGGALQKGATQLRDNVMGTPEQNRLARAKLERMAARKAAEKAALMGGQDGSAALAQGALAGGAAAAAPMPAPMPAPTAAPAAPMPGAPLPMGQKRGGKAGKGCK
jgi:hypothetical protein